MRQKNRRAQDLKTVLVLIWIILLVVTGTALVLALGLLLLLNVLLSMVMCFAAILQSFQEPGFTMANMALKNIALFSLLMFVGGLLNRDTKGRVPFGLIGLFGSWIGIYVLAFFPSYVPFELHVLVGSFLMITAIFSSQLLGTVVGPYFETFIRKHFDQILTKFKF